MGSRLQKIAFIVFALLFIAVMAIMNSSILTMATSANGQLTSIVSSDDASLNIYDQQKVFGSTVAKAAKAPSDVADTIKNVYVITMANEEGVAYSTASKYSSTEADAANVINTTAKFTAYQCINSNNAITGILFIQEGAATDGYADLVANEVSVPGLGATSAASSGADATE
jgi:ABC-type Na+ efflux pump permease subunit